MKQVHRLWILWGIARSLLVYYAKPGRARRDRLFYGQYINRGALVFDVGAHVGNRVNVFLSLGARCVAVEPQPAFASLLRLFYARNPAFTMVQAALAAAPGRADLHVSRRTPTVSTTSAAWKERVGQAPSFARVTWDETVPAKTMTLDQLVDRYGAPDLCKIDVEGSELAVLQGLSRPLPLLSLEYMPAAASDAAACIARLQELGHYEFNWSRGESQRLRANAWLTPAEMTAHLLRLGIDEDSGDVYARLI